MKYYTHYVRHARHDEADYTHEHSTLEQAIADIAAETRFESFDEVQVLIEAPDADSIIAAGAARAKELVAADEACTAEHRALRQLNDRLFYEDLMHPRSVS